MYNMLYEWYSFIIIGRYSKYNILYTIYYYKYNNSQLNYSKKLNLRKFTDWK